MGWVVGGGPWGVNLWVGAWPMGKHEFRGGRLAVRGSGQGVEEKEGRPLNTAEAILKF